MDLKEYLQIILKNIRVFIFVVVLVLVFGLTFFYARPVAYNASLALNITRKSSEQTSAYKYDYYYRLGADEKFADTVVEWLKDPETVDRIYRSSGLSSSDFSLKKLTRILKPERRSSQLVLVYFSASTPETAAHISESIKKELSQNVESLNSLQKDGNWFEILSQEPVIQRQTFFLPWVAMLLLVLGIFLAGWTVLIIHYFNKEA
jgi:capsular polysaccharide biosynthesis protein